MSKLLNCDSGDMIGLMNTSSLLCFVLFDRLSNQEKCFELNAIEYIIYYV